MGKGKQLKLWVLIILVVLFGGSYGEWTNPFMRSILIFGPD